ncbi:hypothetical protein [Kribbella speibonae]|uniref:Uncharacterized protein n=1 Tax=Kribbella speibonae TaxID=1572660 RepID=A0ABY1ZX46_9ACTN|nr:hypothetical protein [Kribbella speibonae]TCC19471.1 hypothetical protein E0H58_31695 [Kribbella speibonae]
MTTPPARQGIGRLIVVVAVTAVAAVAAGGAVAARQVPQAESPTHAAPLGGTPSPRLSATPRTITSPTPTPTPVKTTPKPPPTTAPKPTTVPPSTPQQPSGPIALEAAKLPQGQDPQVTYRFWHTVRGAGKQLTVPGSESLGDIARLGQGVLATTTGGELTELNSAGAVVRRVPHVTTLAGRPDGSAVAYAVTAPVESGEYGATLYSDTGDSERSVKLPDVLSIQILTYAKGTVYYRATAKGSERSGKLYTWTPGTAAPVLVKTVPGEALAVSGDGRLAASLPANNNGDGCSTVVEVATGKKRFQTCDYRISGFTPDGAVALGVPAYGDSYCSNIVTALDARTGKVLRQWSGCFYRVAAEDDRNVLMVAVVSGGGQAPSTKSTIVRCSLDNTTCERATEITSAKDVAFTS